MSTKGIFADDYSKSFAQEAEFIGFLKERDERSSWDVERTKVLRFLALDDNSSKNENVAEGYTDEEREDLLLDTMENTRLLLKAKDKCYPVRSCAVKTILERARISGHALNKVEKPVLARILNHCIRVATGDALLKVSEGKLSAVHGGDRIDYAVLEIPELFEKTVEYLTANFPGAEFVGGFYDHSMVTALWAFPKQDELLDTYKQALDDRGVAHDELQASLRLSTSDVGISGANLYPMLFSGVNRKNITLGSPLKLEHKNGADIAKFEKNLSMIYSQYGDALKRLTALLDVEIQNPLNTMAGVMKRIGVPKKLAFEAIELYEAQHGIGYCTAHDLYLGISEVIFNMQCDGADGSKIASMEENIARALKIRWSDYDIGGELKW